MDNLSIKIQDLIKEVDDVNVCRYLNIAYLLQKQIEESPKAIQCTCNEPYATKGNYKADGSCEMVCGNCGGALSRIRLLEPHSTHPIS